jgi:hypothetical protein
VGQLINYLRATAVDQDASQIFSLTAAILKEHGGALIGADLSAHAPSSCVAE